MANMHPLVRFRPTDEELFAHYLVGKATGAPLPPGLIQERDVYSEEPWNIFDTTSDQTFYVFTMLRKNKSRVLRTAGTGTWKEQHATEIRDARGELVGYKKSFKFKEGGGSSARSGRWIMYEYSMCGEMQCKFVLCKIKNYKDEKKSGQEKIIISDNNQVHFEEVNDGDGWIEQLMDMDPDQLVDPDCLSFLNRFANPSEGDTNEIPTSAFGEPCNRAWDLTSFHQQGNVAEARDQDQPVPLTWADDFLLF